MFVMHLKYTKCLRFVDLPHSKTTVSSGKLSEPSGECPMGMLYGGNLFGRGRFSGLTGARDVTDPSQLSQPTTDSIIKFLSPTRRIARAFIRVSTTAVSHISRISTVVKCSAINVTYLR